MFKGLKLLKPFVIHGVVVSAGLLFHLAVVRLLGTNEAGLFFAGFAMYSVFLMLSLFGQQKGLIANFYFKEGGSFRFVLQNVVVGWAAAILFWQIFVSDVPATFIWAALVSAAVVSLGIYYQDRRLFFISSIFQQYGVRITAILVLLLMGGSNSSTLSYCLLIAAALLVVVGLVFLPRPKGSLVSRKIAPNITTRALIPFWVISVLATLFDSAPIYLAAILSEREFATTLAVVIKVAAICSFSLVAVNRFSIVAYSAKPDDNEFLLQKSSQYGFGAFVVAIPIFAFLFYGAEIVLAFFSEDLASHGNVLRWCLLPHAINVLTGQSSTLLMIVGRVDVTLRNQVLSALVLAGLGAFALLDKSQESVIASFVVPPIVNNVLNCLGARKVLGFWTLVRPRF